MDTLMDPQPTIVVGVDGSNCSRIALRWANRLALGLDARLLAVTAWSYPVGYGWTPNPEDWNPREEAVRVLRDTVQAALGHDRATAVAYAVDEGNAARVILEHARDALMIVVGSRGHGGFAGLLMGSVSAGVSQHAGCPVLVVHDDATVPAGEHARSSVAVAD